ncbi:hypothetical protein ALP23_102179 [Pseudomonas syringae pv. apii]|uniref:Uncharacterized protein n=1 Tax=Pseudomonas syringae pv. apii TaxID=81036 RepID=A0A3M5WLM8_9PSED|nr:hypothetical protein ALP23_102179 [Pseudomonas syringae pv. apii]
MALCQGSTFSSKYLAKVHFQVRSAREFHRPIGTHHCR